MFQHVNVYVSDSCFSTSVSATASAVTLFAGVTAAMAGIGLTLAVSVFLYHDGFKHIRLL